MPQLRTVDGLQQAAKDDALARLGEMLQTGKVIGIGSPRASLEANFALRTLVGAENFYAGISQQQHALSQQILAILQQGSGTHRPPSRMSRAPMPSSSSGKMSIMSPRCWHLPCGRPSCKRPKRELLPELHIAPYGRLSDA